MTQLTFDLQHELAERELGRATVEARNQFFVERARGYAIHISSLKGSVTSDDLREWARRYGLAPSHPNCWGAIIRGKGWRVIGRKPSALPGSHAREIKVWAYEG